MIYGEEIINYRCYFGTKIEMINLRKTIAVKSDTKINLLFLWN
jgi:hypothetical protein|tara:strand:- start:402 stop:530 length:129 start_codon:yes stop_codon:yes gene_type:complete